MHLRPALFLTLSASLVLGLIAAPAHAQSGASGDAPKLQSVAKFPDQQITGIAVSKDGRIFVNLPRWHQDVAISVAEVVDGKLKPYPNAGWNAWRNAKMNSVSPKDHFVSVQSVMFDSQGFLWAVDPAAPAMDRVVDGGAKLVKIDIARNAVVQTIPFDASIAPAKSYLNDVRFSPDGHFAYLTDSGLGAIVVVDLQSGKARRVLDKDPSTQPEKDVLVHADGRELRRPDGRAMVTASDGITTSPDGQYLYWQALTGRTLYRVPAAALSDPKLKPADLSAKVEKVAITNAADGLWTDPQGRIYISAPEEDAVKILDGIAVKMLVQDDRLRWPDSFAQGPDGAIYITASHIQDSPWFLPDRKATPSEIFKFMPPAAPETVGGAPR